MLPYVAEQHVVAELPQLGNELVHRRFLLSHVSISSCKDLAANEHPRAKPRQHATFSGPTEWSRGSGQAKGVSGCCEASPTWRHRLVRPQEGAHLVDRLLEQVLRLSPRKYR